MGCACLRGDGHRRFVRRAGGPAAGGRQQGSLARQPDAAGPDARSQLLCRRGDADAIWIRLAKGEPDAVPNPNANAVAIRERLGNRQRQPQRLRDAMPIAGCDADAVSVADAQCQRETLDLALGPLQQSFESVQE